MHLPLNKPDTADDVILILSTALLADGDLDDPELRALDGLCIDHALGVSPGSFRTVLHDYCRRLMVDDDGAAGLSLLDPAHIGEAVRLLHDPAHRLASSARLVELMHDDDPVQLECRLLDPALLDAALGRIVDPQLRFWTCTVLLHLINADGELHRNEVSVLKHVLKRWQLTPDALGSGCPPRPS